MLVHREAGVGVGVEGFVEAGGEEAGGEAGGATPILPADLSLRISLPDFKVHSERRGGLVAARDIRAVERGARIGFE